MKNKESQSEKAYGDYKKYYRDSNYYHYIISSHTIDLWHDWKKTKEVDIYRERQNF